jgi:hypothetical protein
MEVSDMAGLPGGGYLIGGTANFVPEGGALQGYYDGVCIKLNDKGKVEYVKTIGSTDLDRLTDIVVHDDGFTLLGIYGKEDGDFQGLGHYYSQDAYAFSYGADGSLRRKVVWGGSAGEADTKAITTDDGGLLVMGTTSSEDGAFESRNNNLSDAYLLKLSAQGNIEWTRIFGGSGTDAGVDILETGADAYLLAMSFSASTEGEFKDQNKGSTDLAFFGVDSEGSILWNSFMGDTSADKPLRLRRDSGGEVIALIQSGGTQADFADVFYEPQYSTSVGFIKLAADDGELLYKTRFRASGSNALSDFALTVDDGMLATGNCTNGPEPFSGLNRGGVDATLVKFDGAPQTVSKTVLSALIASASAISPDVGKPALSAALAASITKAQAAVGNSYASQGAINDVTEHLRDAMDVFNSATEVNWTGLTANGASNTENTSELTLTFDADPGDLKASDISVTGASSWEISGSGNTRTLTVSGLTVNNAANLTVSILKNPEGVFVASVSKNVAANRGPDISWNLSAANGEPGEKDTTVLKLSFDNRPVDINDNYISVEGATKGYLAYVAPYYLLPISDIEAEDGGLISVTVTDTARYRFTESTKTVSISKKVTAPEPPAPDTTAPVLSAPSVIRNGHNTATIAFSTTEAGTARYLVVGRAGSTPSKEIVRDRGTYLGAVDTGKVSGKQILLFAGDKDIYLTVEDSAGNISEPLKIAADAYSPLATKPVVTATDITKLTLKVSDRVWTGKNIVTGFVIKAGTKTLKAGSDYRLSSFKGNKAIGKGSFVITGIGAYTGSRTLSFNILPKAPQSLKAKAAKRSLKVSFKKVAKAQKISKYQVRYRTRGASKWKIKTLSAKKASLTLKGLKRTKRYQVQVRTFKTVVKVRYASAWSKTVTTKKVR